MKQYQSLSIIAFAALLTACGGGGGGDDSEPETGKPPVTEQPDTSVPDNGSYPSTILPSDYSAKERADIYGKVNANRTTCGFSSIKQNSMLDIAAMGHADYLQKNNTVGHSQVNTNPGFTGADMLARATAASYQASRLGEILNNSLGGTLFAGTSPSGIETSANKPTGTEMINRLFSTVYHLGLATSEWNEMGVGYSVSDNQTSLAGETMYYAASVVNFGTPAGGNAPAYTDGKIRSFPCDGIEGVSPIFTAESPSPYPSRDLNAAPMGTPVLVTSAFGGSMNIDSASMTVAASNIPVASNIFNSTDDVNKLLGLNQAYVVPDQPLAPNTKYNVTVNGTSDGKPFTKNIFFTTGTQN